MQRRHPAIGAFAKVLAAVAASVLLLFAIDRARRPWPVAPSPARVIAPTATPTTSPVALPVLAEQEPLGPNAEAAVKRSIRGAVDFLFSTQLQAGHWDVPDDDSETTAIVLYTLAHVAQPLDDPRLARAVQRICSAAPGPTRATAWRLLALADLPPTTERFALARHDANVLMASAMLRGLSGTFHTHGLNDLRLSLDDQAVALDAILAAHDRLGIALPAGHLSRVREGWRTIIRGTPAELSALFPDDPPARFRQLDTLAQAAWALRLLAIDDDARPIFAAKEDYAKVPLAALADSYPSLYAQPSPYEAVHAFARAMLADRARFVAGRDWYKDAIVFLLRHQRADGAWARPASTETADPRHAIVDTCHALLTYACGTQLPDRDRIPFDRFDDREFWAHVARRPADSPAPAPKLDDQITAAFPPLAEELRRAGDAANRRPAALVAAPAEQSRRRAVGLAAVTPAPAPDAFAAQTGRFADLRNALARDGVHLSVDSITLGNWNLQRYEVAWITGRQIIDLTRLQRLELKRFFDVGGTLLVEAMDAEREIDAVQGQLIALFADRNLTFTESYPADSPPETARPIHVARLDDGPAILLTVRPAQSDVLLHAALAARSK